LDTPTGDWVILRLGYPLIGTTNHPATKEATGLEVDKLNSLFVRHYIEHYLDNYARVVGPGMMGSRGIQNVVTDSWEAGAQNWTDNLLQEFAKRRGYDPIPWLPLLSGRVVDSGESSDKFLWDFRKTIADLVADGHYGQLAASIKARGMLHYGESDENGRAMIADGMEVRNWTMSLWERCGSILQAIIDGCITSTPMIASHHPSHIFTARTLLPLNR
jgi:hypothetical protein